MINTKSVIVLVILTMSAAAAAQVQTTENYIVPTDDSVGYFNPATVYATNDDAPGCGDLVQIVSVMDGSDKFVGIRIRRSEDNGKTWSPFEYIEKQKWIGDDRLTYGTGSLFADPDNGMMILFSQQLYYANDRIASTWRKRKIVYRISRDNGRTWSDRRQIIQSGKDSQGQAFDEEHWMAGAVYGRNMGCTIAGKAIKLQSSGANKNKILLPFQLQAVDEAGGLYMPTGGGFMRSGTLIGTWNDDLTDLTWDCSQQVGVSPKVSSRGVFEPTVAEFPDGKLIMIMRGSNAGLTDVKGVRFFSVSPDQGHIWSSPRPLLYDDLTTVPSSSSLALLQRTEDGSVWYCGVVAEKKPRGNWPRYPVVVAQLDPDTACLKKATMIEVVDRHGDDPRGAQYVNHWVYQDPVRNALVVLTPHITGSIAAPVHRHVVPLP